MWLISKLFKISIFICIAMILSHSETYIIAIKDAAELEESDITIFVIILGINMLKVSKINGNLYAIISKLFKISIFICITMILSDSETYIIAIKDAAELEESDITIFCHYFGINMLKVSKINWNFLCAIISKLFKIYMIFICILQNLRRCDHHFCLFLLTSVSKINWNFCAYNCYQRCDSAK